MSNRIFESKIPLTGSDVAQTTIAVRAVFYAISICLPRCFVEKIDLALYYWHRYQCLLIIERYKNLAEMKDFN